MISKVNGAAVESPKWHQHDVDASETGDAEHHQSRDEAKRPSRNAVESSDDSAGVKERVSKKDHELRLVQSRFDAGFHQAVADARRGAAP